MSPRKKQQSNYTIFIACEGSVSEKQYFSAIRDVVQDSWGVSIEIYPPDPQSPNDPLKLVSIARERSNIFKEVWAVFDKDGDDHVPDQVFTEAGKEVNGKIVNIGYSSIAFEHWVLLYYEKNKTAFLKSDCKDKERKEHFYCGQPGTNHKDDCGGSRCVANTIRHKYLGNYGKKDEFALYERIKHRDWVVLENAAWLRFVMQASLNPQEAKEINPYTNLDVLVKRLFDNKEIILWRPYDTFYSNYEIDVCVKYDKPLITVLIKNKDADRFFINLIQNDWFYLSNDQGENCGVEYKNSRILSNVSGSALQTENTISLFENDVAEIQLSVNPSIEYPFYFNFKYKATRNMFII